MDNENHEKERIDKVRLTLSKMSIADLIALHGYLERTKERIGRAYVSDSSQISTELLSEMKSKNMERQKLISDEIRDRTALIFED